MRPIAYLLLPILPLLTVGCTLFAVEAPINANAELCGPDSQAVICCPEALIFDMDAVLNGDQLVLKCRSDDDAGHHHADGDGGDVP